MNEWIDELCDLTAAGERVVLVTVAGIRGSAPREAGAKMLVTANETIGTIGGGQLEYQCTHIASDMLGDEEARVLRKFPLGSAMGQCCGGVVEVLFESLADGMPAWLRDLQALHGQREPAALVTPLAGRGRKFVVTASELYGGPDSAMPQAIAAARDGLAKGRSIAREGDVLLESVIGSDFNIAVFGAGHVGSAVVRALAALDCNVRWIDSRRNIFRGVPSNARAIESPVPALEVAAMPAGGCYLVMTHSHALDFEICDRILRRADATYCGLIGSLSKRRRFEKRFRAQGMPEHLLGRLTCPIGVAGISGKKPAEIAVAATAELLQARELAARREQHFPPNVHPLRRPR